MNNAARGVILAIALAGMALMFFVMISSIDDGGAERDFSLKDLANVLSGGLGMVSCAIIAGAALMGLEPSKAPPRPVTFPHQQQGQPYPQPAAVPQQYAPQQQYGQQPQQQQYGQQPPPQD